MKIAPSILACDLANLEKEAKSVSNADFLHIDVMDGLFVPNISFGLPVISALRKKTDMIFDVHLMIQNPENYISRFAEAGSDYITIHTESTEKVRECIDEIHSLGKKAGITIKPNTELSTINEFLALVDMVLIMTVEPGFGGQSIIYSCLDKSEKLKELRDKNGYNFVIEADGGIDEKNLSFVSSKGVDISVMGSAVFKLDTNIRNKKIREFQNY